MPLYIDKINGFYKDDGIRFSSVDYTYLHI